MIACPVCNGTGLYNYKLGSDDTSPVCKSCGGTGMVPQTFIEIAQPHVIIRLDGRIYVANKDHEGEHPVVDIKLTKEQLVVLKEMFEDYLNAAD